VRRLADVNILISPEIVLVPMRGLYDCFTCVTAMLLNITYEDVVAAFGGNIDPSKGKAEECQRIYWAFETLIQKHHHGALHYLELPAIGAGRRYWISVHIDDPTNPLSNEMSHSIVVDEAGRVFDPNPRYGKFKSLAEWQAAMSLPHKIEFAAEIYEYTL
jgi:hypothetical protein